MRCTCVTIRSCLLLLCRSAVGPVFADRVYSFLGLTLLVLLRLLQGICTGADREIGSPCSGEVVFLFLAFILGWTGGLACLIIPFSILCTLKNYHGPENHWLVEENSLPWPLSGSMLVLGSVAFFRIFLCWCLVPHRRPRTQKKSAGKKITGGKKMKMHFTGYQRSHRFWHVSQEPSTKLSGGRLPQVRRLGIHR